MKKYGVDNWRVTYIYKDQTGKTCILNTEAKMSGTRQDVIDEARIWVASSPMSPIRIEATPID